MNAIFLVGLKWNKLDIIMTRWIVSCLESTTSAQPVLALSGTGNN
jgi:hypothetical protein